MMENESLQVYSARREALLAEIVQTLSGDERFVAAWLTGSLGRNEADAVSDLDLSVVVADAFSETLCAYTEPIAAQTTPERLALFSRFGAPVILHENNYNAPDGGTMTFVMYQTGVMVDWVLIPAVKAQRLPQSRLLFDKVSVPLSSVAEPEDLAERAKQASEQVAFFWMMMAVAIKYMIRGDAVFVAVWLEELHRMLGHVERLVAGQAWTYQRGSRSQLAATREAQESAIRQLCDRMLRLMPEVANLGGYVHPSPMTGIEVLLHLK